MAFAAEAVEEAATRGAELVAFPEAFLPGFPYWLNVYPPTAVAHLYRWSWQEAVDERATALDPIATAARKRGIAVVIGATRRRGGSLHNSLLCLDQCGRLVGARDKLVPTAAERTLWDRSRRAELKCWETGAARLSGLMCFEHTASLPRELIARQGPQVHVAAWPGLAGLAGHEAHYHLRVDALARSHAIMTQSFVLSAMNPITPELLARVEAAVGAPLDGLAPAAGWSAILHPGGATVAETVAGDDELLVAEVDLDEIIDAKRVVDADGHSARDDLFEVRATTAGEPR